MLQVSNLTRRYGSFVAVNNASFSIGHGEIVGLLGHNGAGKTTIMKMLSGYLEPDNGTICIDNNDIATYMKVAQQDLGYLPENLPVYPEMMVADYLEYAAKLKGVSDNDKYSEIKRVVSATDIGEKLLEPIHTLSRGFKQRVGVAQAILAKPKILILDEPTNGLDPTQTEHMRTLIRDIAKEATVILSTHIMQEVDALCDRVLILNRGELAVDAKLDDLRISNRLSIKTSLVNAEFVSLFDSINNASAQALNFHEEEDGISAYTLELTDQQNTNDVASAVAAAVVNAGASLFQLNIEKRDLESLFKEANRQPLEKEAINNAA